MINVWDLWTKEWKNASNFFNSKGNSKTTSRLKDKWYNDFKKMLFMIEKEILKNDKGKIN